jgi:hypothetical protein
MVLLTQPEPGQDEEEEEGTNLAAHLESPATQPQGGNDGQESNSLQVQGIVEQEPAHGPGSGAAHKVEGWWRRLTQGRAVATGSNTDVESPEQIQGRLQSGLQSRCDGGGMDLASAPAPAADSHLVSNPVELRLPPSFSTSCKSVGVDASTIKHEEDTSEKVCGMQSNTAVRPPQPASHTPTPAWLVTFIPYAATFAPSSLLAS